MKTTLVVQAAPLSHPGHHRSLVVNNKPRICAVLKEQMEPVGAPSSGLYLMTIETVQTRRQANGRCSTLASAVFVYGTGCEFPACYLTRRYRGKYVKVTFTQLGCA